MYAAVLLNDVIVGDGYVKIVTDQGSFTKWSSEGELDLIALKCLKLVGKRIDLQLDPDQPFSGHFIDANPATDDHEQQTFPIGRSFSNKHSQKIFGPPGTGKTTKLIGYVSAAVKSGVKPHDIGFISFSNGAATVAKKRVIEELPEYGVVDFPNFSTMHSLATKVGSETGMKLMVEEHFLNFDNTIECWQEWTELANPLGAVERYKHPILDEYNLSIAEGRSPNFSLPNLGHKQRVLLEKRLAQRFSTDQNLNLEDLASKYVDAFLSYKQERRLITFDDVIEKVVSDEFPTSLIPTFELLIIDEAQDLSNHLWSFAHKLIRNAKISYIAGDADQAIMIGIGANPTAFVNCLTSEPDDPLENSFRVPKAVREYVDKGIMPELSLLPDRVNTNWRPAKREGYLNAGFKTLVQDENDNAVVKANDFTIQFLLERIKQDYLLFTQGQIEPDERIFLQNTESIMRNTLKLNDITGVKISQLLQTAAQSMEIDNLKQLQIKIAKGEILASAIIKCSFPSKDLRDIEFLPDIDRLASIPDWLVMAPTKRTGEKLSMALAELNVPHFHRNKPVLGAETDQTLIRVQTVHMSKGDQATNAAVVISSEGDVFMLANDVRLAYVAATRASHSCFPRVSREGLLPGMEDDDYWRPSVRKYKKLFPSN